MPARTLVNGVSLRDLGMIVRQTPRFRSGPARSLTMAAPLGVLGQRLLGVATYPAKDLPIVGTALADTYAAACALEDRLKNVCGGAPAEIVVDDLVTVRRTVGTLVTPDIARYDPQFRSRASAVSFTFTCPMPLWEDVEPTTRHLTSNPPRRFALQLGNAPCFGTIELMGPAAAPLKVRLRDAGGVVRWELAFQTVSLANTSESLFIDNINGRITKYALGVGTDVLGLLDAASQPFFPAAFDPQDGDFDTAAWPTLETDVGIARAQYWQTRL